MKTNDTNRKRSARVAMLMFPQFRQAIDKHWKDKGFTSMTEFILAAIAEKIGWEGPF